MRNGFYLAAYIHIDPVAHLYNFHIRHDQNISLWKKEGNKVELIHFWELERITGLKRHSRSFYSLQQARELIGILLKSYDLTFDDLQEVIGTPQLDTTKDYDSIKENDELAYHSICHLYSSMLVNTDIFNNEDIIALALDGGPDSVVDKAIYKKQFYAGAVSKKGNVELFPVCSPGFLWTYLRKKYNMREGSLMALATASKSVLYRQEEDIVKIYNGRDLKAAYQYIDELALLADKLEEKDAGKLFNGFDTNFSNQDNRISMVAKIVQNMSIRILEHNVDWILEKYGLDASNTYISMSGGFGLNCPTNSFLLKKYNFRGFLAPPCVNDSGISIGMALYYFWKEDPQIEFRLESSYYGNSDDSFEKIKRKYSDYIQSVKELNEEIFLDDIEKTPVVWFDGRAEIGPRALGHRSLLAVPTKEEDKHKLNLIKQRQWWRPVAPIVLYEDMGEWFEGDNDSPFMLHTLYVKTDKTKLVPGICHLDNSARVQSLKKCDNPTLYHLIAAYKEKTGIPIICNTSLNDIGEPIIDTIEECMNFALRKDIKVVYVNELRIELKNHAAYPESRPSKRNYNFNIFSESELRSLKKKYNPYQLTEEQLICKYNRPDLGEAVDITKKEDVEKLKKFSTLVKSKLGNIPTLGL